MKAFRQLLAIIMALTLCACPPVEDLQSTGDGLGNGTVLALPPTSITSSSSAYMRSPKNIFPYSDQCTTYAYGRVVELVERGILEESIRSWFYNSFHGKSGRHARYWPDFLGGDWVRTGQQPLDWGWRKVPMLVVWQFGEHGHVAVVEEISSDLLRYRVVDFNYHGDGRKGSRWYSFDGDDRMGGVYPMFLLLPSATQTRQMVSVSSNRIVRGEKVTVKWSGFSGNVNLGLYRNGSFWIHASTTAPGTGEQVLDSSGWQPGTYKLLAEQRSNTNVHAWSSEIVVETATIPQLSVSPTQVATGGQVAANWSGFSGRINLGVWRNGVFWLYAATDVGGSGEQTLSTSGWTPGAYKLLAELRSNTSVRVWSSALNVSQPQPPQEPKPKVSLSFTAYAPLGDTVGDVTLRLDNYSESRDGNLWLYLSNGLNVAQDPWFYGRWYEKARVRLRDVVTESRPTVTLQTVYHWADQEALAYLAFLSTDGNLAAWGEPTPPQVEISFSLPLTMENVPEMLRRNGLVYNILQRAQ